MATITGAKKEIGSTVYICEEPSCKKRIIAPNRGEILRKKHRDMNGHYCTKLLMRRDISPTGRAEEMEARWAEERFKKGSMDHPRYRPGDLKDEPVLGLTHRIRKGITKGSKAK